jgi:hypothetical protein
MTLDAIFENQANPIGTPVSEILASGGGDRITDPDAGAVEGIEVNQQEEPRPQNESPETEKDEGARSEDSAGAPATGASSAPQEYASQHPKKRSFFRKWSRFRRPTGCWKNRILPTS